MNFEQSAIIDTPKYSTFHMPYESIGTMLMGVGYPVLHKEIVPGDDFRVSVDQIMRLAPLQSPVFDDVEMHFRAYFVPNRILDSRWKEFITGGVGLYGSSDNEIQNLSFTVRSLVSSSQFLRQSPDGGYSRVDWCAAPGSLADWLNFHFAKYATDAFQRPITPNTTDTQNLTYQNSAAHAFSLLPFLGYQKIFDDWYRNERLQAERLPSIISFLEAGANSRLWDFDEYDTAVFNPYQNVSPFWLWRVNYSKDRYTTALPEPVVGGEVNATSTQQLYGTVRTPAYCSGGEDGNVVSLQNIDGLKDAGVWLGRDSSGVPLTTPLVASLVAAAETTVRQLKTAFKMYSFFMKDTYNGNRYVEFIQSHFDVTVPDATLDRAIYLGDHKTRISFGEVFQTSGANPEDGNGVLGDYAGRGAAYSEDGFLFEEKFLEHGQLYVIASIVPRAKYFQGVDRKFIKDDRFDYFFPEFQNIGDVAFRNCELYNTGNDAIDLSNFGFGPRWSELKENLDEVHGDFLTNMDEYHFGRVFGTRPRISELFSQVQTENRPFVTISEYSENYLANMRFNVVAKRPLMMYETF